MRGTAAVLLVDFLAAMAVITFGILYARASPIDLVILGGLTFALFFLVSALLSKSDQYVRKEQSKAGQSQVEVRGTGTEPKVRIANTHGG